jgi:uncharacterized protein YndB with AHSA1/START domain
MNMPANTKSTTVKPTGASAAPRLVIERTFDASPERVWSFFVDPKKYAKWLNPSPNDLIIHEFDVRVGGRVRFDMPLPDGTLMNNEGVFHVIDAPRHLVSGAPDKSFLIDLTFEPKAPNKTHMRAVITGVPPQHHDGATKGWNAGLDKLATGLAREPRGRVTPDRYVEVERWFKASPERVFAAWSKPEQMEKTFWPVGTGKVKELSFKPGGKLVMGHVEQPDWTAIWEYLEIVPDRKIVIRDVWPDGSGLSATGTLEFLPQDGGTLMKVRHGPFPKTGPYQPEGAVAGFTMGTERVAELVETPGPGEGFTLVRHFAAPPKKVWDMWTTKEGLAKWWKQGAADLGYDFTVKELDVRPGGKYDLVMSNKAQGELHNHGTYTAVVPHRMLAQVWDFDIFLAPGEKPYPIVIRVELEEEPTMDGKTGTKMTFHQGPMAKPEFTEGSRQGVANNLRHMEKALG